MTKNLFIVMLLTILAFGKTVNASIPVNGKSENSTKTLDKKLVQETLFVSYTNVLQSFSDTDNSTLNNTESTSNRIDEELLVTLLLWFFLGFLAGHRWYRGKPTGWNILFILTGGGCGIWALVDLVHILTGKF